jgi:hypothetical protein
LKEVVKLVSSHNKRLFEELKKLNLPADQYVVFGSGPMGIRGMREIHDVDIFVTEKLWNELSKVHESKTKESIQLSPNIEAIRTWFPGKWNVEELINEADMIDGIRFVRLNSVYEWKRKRMAPKDKKDLELLESHFEVKKKDRNNKVCGICGAPHYAKGLCKRHYQQSYRSRQKARFGRRSRRNKR